MGFYCLYYADGRTVSERALSKIRLGESGIDYAIRQLQDLGAPAPVPFEDKARYVDRALEEGGFRRVRHPGNHAFIWSL